MDEQQAAQLGVSPDEPQPDVRSVVEVELPRHDADAAYSGERTDADDDCDNAAGVEAEEAGVRSPDPMCRR